MQWLFSFLVFHSLVVVGSACCMLPETYEGSIGQRTQEALVIHSADRQELILRINYAIKGEEMPEHFAWVVTVPNEPEKYTLANPDIFKKMFTLSQNVLQPKPRSTGMEPFGGVPTLQMEKGVELGKRVQVGPYDIQPVRGVGKNALTGLNTWLKENGYPTEDPEHMRYFVENGFTFLAVKIKPARGKRGVPAGGRLAPLHLSFKSTTPYYPLRFSSLQGRFDVNIHLLTKEPIDFEKNEDMLRKLNWSSAHYEQNYSLNLEKSPKELEAIFEKSVIGSEDKQWMYNNIRFHQVNQNKSLAKLETDIFFKILE